MTSLPQKKVSRGYLDQVFFGHFSLADYLQVRLSRSQNTAVMGPYTRPLTRWRGNSTSPRYVQWIGWISQRVGAYVGTGLYDPALVRAAFQIKDHAATWGWRSGLSKKYADNYVAACPTAIIEADEGTLQQQLDELDRLEHDSRLRFALLTLSGDTRPTSVTAADLDPKNLQAGKSIHAELLYEIPLDPRKPADEALRLRIQRLLIVLLKADPAIINADRLMRAGGIVGFHSGKLTSEAGYRIQTLLRAEKVAFLPQAVESALSAVCRSRLGADDDARLDVAIDSLVDAHALSNLNLRALDYAETLEIDRLRDDLRSGRSPLQGEDGQVVDALLGRLPPPTSSRKQWVGTGSKARTTNGTRSRWGLRTVQWEPLLRAAGLWLGSSHGRWHNLECPFPHGSANKPGDTGVIDSRGAQPGGFRCFHGSCSGRTAHDLLIWLESHLGRNEVAKYVQSIIGAVDDEEIDLDDLAPEAQADLDSFLDDILQFPGEPPPPTPAELSARAAQEAAQQAKERAESNARLDAFEQAMAPYRARVDARKKAGKQVPRAVAIGAHLACQTIRAEQPQHPERQGWATTIRRHWESMGLDRSSYHGCGHYQVVTDPYTGRHVMVRRRCGKLTCYVCGPQRVALAAAAMAYVPLHSSAHGIGASMGGLRGMGAYVHVIARDKVSSWLQAWRRQELIQPIYVRFHKVKALSERESDSIYNIGIADSRSQPYATCRYLFANRPIKSGVGHNVHGWTLFEPPKTRSRGRPPKLLVLSTFALETRRGRRRWGRPRYLTPEDVPEYLLQATINTYRFRPAPGPGGVGDVMGRVRSSRSISVDPETIRTAAAGSEYTVTVPRADAAAVAADPLWQQYTATTTTDPYSGDMSSRATRPVHDASLAGHFWASAKARRQPGMGQTVVHLAPSDDDEDLDDVLGGK